MTDPFSISAGVVGVVSLGLAVSQGFLSFYTPWKTYDEEIQHFTGKLDGLQNILNVVEGFILNDDEFNLASDQYEKLVLANIASCQQACRRLEEMLDKCKSADCSLFVRKSDWLRLRRAAYPFKKETLLTLSQTVSGLQDNLNLALQLMNRFVLLSLASITNPALIRSKRAHQSATEATSRYNFTHNLHRHPDNSNS